MEQALRPTHNAITVPNVSGGGAGVKIGAAVSVQAPITEKHQWGSWIVPGPENELNCNFSINSNH
jgi:hypothetical protein